MLRPAQAETLQTMVESRKLLILNVRQLDISWLSLGRALWLMFFQAPATTLLCWLARAVIAALPALFVTLIVSGLAAGPLWALLESR